MIMMEDDAILSRSSKQLKDTIDLAIEELQW